VISSLHIVRLDRRVSGAGPRERPLVPRTLRVALAHQPLPDWLLEATGLPAGATVEALRPELVEAVSDRLGRRIELLVNRLLENHRAAVRDTPLVDRPWPRSVDWGEWIGRRLALNGLTRDRLIRSEATYGDLLALPQVGARSVYEIAVAAEVALDHAYACVELPQELVELRRKAASTSWAGLVGGEDARFSDLFASRDRPLSDYLDLAGRPDSGTARDAELVLASLLPAVCKRVALIERSPLEVAIRSYVEALSGLSGELLDAVIRRFGLDGTPPRTLVGAVDGTNVGPERLRQLQARLRDRIPSQPVYMPALDRALELLAEAVPTSAAEAATSLHLSGISTIPFHPASVISAARLCGRSVDFEVESSVAGTFVVKRCARTQRPWFVRSAVRRASSFGVASLGQLMSAGDATGTRLSTADARDLVARYCLAQFLDDDWFWLPDRNQNRLRTLTRRMLSVASPLDLATIRAGICRAYPSGRAELIPPVPVMAAFYAADPGFVIDARGRVRPRDPLDPRNELGKSDRVFVDVLRSSATGALDGASFRDSCATQGMTRQTFYAVTRLSPVLDRRPSGGWCLRS
jgi:hypothetical protein